ncbi:MAG: glycosyltransferase family 39 protein [Myxococcales bacterium]|nr:glycosyltransferase family 39 protein [Myxococcales bacterium]MCB9628485.1 glycosyltransferase family 39 protein [Sandaracinaceae bacterium]
MTDQTPSPSPPSPPRTPLSLERKLGWCAFALGVVAMFLLMSNSDHAPRGVLMGMAATLTAALGLMTGLGFFTRSEASVPFASSALGHAADEAWFRRPSVMLPISVAVVVACALLFGVETFRVDDVAGIPLDVAYMTVAIVLALLLLLPAAVTRPGLGVFVVVGLVYLPTLGMPALWDPWETHYGEVAREILARDDWISTWWAHEKWFMSKPILIFWMEALSMGALGVDYLPDANPAHPEWAVRLPIMLLSIAALMVVYGTVKRLFSARAGAFAALAMATAPHYFFLAHQAITDMSMVGNMTIAVCLLALALSESPEREVTRYRIGRLEGSFQHIILGLLLVTVLPQVMYLITRNVTWFPRGFAWHLDEFFYGSAGNDGIPGNPDIADQQAVFNELWFQPAVQGALWLVGLAGLVYLLSRERRAQALAMYGFYYFCGLAFMGKGIPGFALPGLVALLYLIASTRWDVLLEGRLRVMPGTLTLAVTGLPWYVAMYMRHGPAFTQQLLIHDHINRLARGVHMDETSPGSFGYYVLQLGFATFPYIGLVPFAVVAFMWLRRRQRTAVQASDGRAYHQRQFLMLLSLWFFAAFVLFSAMATRFHHYIFPAVVPAMILVGLMLDAMCGEDARPMRVRFVTALLAGLGPLSFVLGFAGMMGDVRGILPPGEEGTDWVLGAAQRGDTPAMLALMALGLACAGAAYFLLHRRDAGAPEPTREAGRLALPLTVACLAGAGLLAFVARDLSWVTQQRPHGYERLIHLYVYNYNRPWPTQFDYRPILTAFGIVGSVLLALTALPRLRAWGARLLVGFSVVFAAWTVNVYFSDLSDHWGLKPLMTQYYQLREGPEEPLIAFQMNWKAENFYTGNRVYTFVDLDTAPLARWIEQNRGKRVFVLVERTRLRTFTGLVGGRPEVIEHTSTRQCSKFVLAEMTL